LQLAVSRSPGHERFERLAGRERAKSEGCTPPESDEAARLTDATLNVLSSLTHTDLEEPGSYR
jgi:hypothetical protein